MVPLVLNVLILSGLNWIVQDVIGSFILSDFSMQKPTAGLCGCLYPGSHRHARTIVGCAVSCGLSGICKGFLFNRYTGRCIALPTGCSEQVDLSALQDYEYHVKRKGNETGKNIIIRYSYISK